MPLCWKSRVAAHIDVSILGRSPCAESGILFSFIQGGRGGGGGGPGPTAGKHSGQRFFLVLFFYSPELILQLTEGSNGFITEKTILFKGSRGGPEFSRGRGSNFFLMLISKETHITCDFPGDPNPPPPLSIRICLRMRDFIEYS